MTNKIVAFPNRTKIQNHIILSLKRYWQKNENYIDSLPIIKKDKDLTIKLPLKLIEVSLPAWASKWGVEGKLLIPQELTPNIKTIDKNNEWKNIDWFLVIFVMMESWHEREWEIMHGTIHSYSFRLRGWDTRIWDRAWVNRIALFMREWAAYNHNTTANDLLGTLPLNNIVMTHDVDAIKKTITIRIKQGGFIVFNIIRLLFYFKITAAIKKTQQFLKFLFSRENWWQFEYLLSTEAIAGIKSVFHFYAPSHKKTLKNWIFDPGYSIYKTILKDLILKIKNDGHQIGLHPSFESWNDLNSIIDQKKKLEAISKKPVFACRQHWLRFSWSLTWSAQQGAGLNLDRTLMFNDRPGFRNASAICWRPWNIEVDTNWNLSAQTTVLMDSHFYDYQLLSDLQRKDHIRYWINECQAVHGETAVLWHPHTLSSDYGWKEGFKELLNAISQKKII
jgi:hypothetical protein